MKRKLGYVLLLFILLAIVVAYILRYETSACMCKTIPLDAVAVVQIKVRSMEKYFLQDMLSRPASYFSSVSDTEEQNNQTDLEENQPSTKPDAKASLMDCVSTPKSLLFYKLSNGVWYSSELEIKDTPKLKKFLEQNDFESSGPADNEEYTRKNLTILIDGEKVQLAYEGTSTSSKGISTQEQSGFMAEGDQLFDATLGSVSDIHFVDDNGHFLDVNFGQGVINVNGNYNMPALQPSAAEVKSQGLGTLSAKLDFPKFLDLLSTDQKDKFSNFTKLNLDTLSGFMSGDVNAVFSDFTASVDTITTYEYDDNFNKVEVNDIKHTEEPSYLLSVGADTSIMSYLRRQNAIVEKEGRNILAIMPLVTTYSQHSSSGLYLYTADMDSTQVKTSTSNSKLIFDFNVRNYLEKVDSGSQHKILRDMERMYLSIDNENNIDGKILFQDKRNGLVSLMR